MKTREEVDVILYSARSNDLPSLLAQDAADVRVRSDSQSTVIQGDRYFVLKTT